MFCPVPNDEEGFFLLLHMRGRQAMGLSWHDTDEIALQLLIKNPHIRPADVPLRDLPKWVAELPDFEDDLTAPPEGVLRALHDQWAEEWIEVNS